MFNRTLLQRMIVVIIVIVALALFGVVAFRYQTTDIPVLAVKVVAGSVIDGNNIKTISWPGNAVFPGLATSKEQLSGKTAAIDIEAGAPVTLNQIGTSVIQSDPRFPAANALDENKLKWFVPVDQRRSSGGVILPGDYVDVVQSDPGNQTGLFLLQKIHVVGGQTSNLIVGYMLALTPSQVSLLAAVDFQTLILVPTTLSAPDLPGVSSGLEASQQTADSSASPTPTPSPVPSPTPALTPGPSGSPTP